ncbi:MAG: ATP-binding cassette domain-containing protein [Clostridia bacterium]|nr:ATP-binding cassette domain-containing protein [Clostridia bacterium]
MIKIINLSKKFSDNTVIDKLDLIVNSGEITALVGKNGVGKSTLIRLIAKLLKSDSGEIKTEPGAKIGVLLGGDVSLYENLTAFEIINYFGELHGMDSVSIKERIDVLDDILNFKSFINERASTFSRGMKQKIAIVVSIIHNPDILLLDEPSTGLDIEASNDVIKFIKYLKSQKKTILIATHNIFEISDLSDSIAFIKNGKIQRKIKTEDFFKNCPQDEKYAHILSLMKGEDE